LHKDHGEEFIYLVSLFRHEFAKITLQGNVVWVRGFPEKSGVYKAKEEFRPTGITVAPNGDVYVTDGYGTNYIHHYDGKGEYLNSWGGKCGPSKENGKFSTPHKIIIDRRGTMYDPVVVDTFLESHHRVMPSTDSKPHPAAQAIGDARSQDREEQRQQAVALPPDGSLSDGLLAVTSLSRAVSGGARVGDVGAVVGGGR